MMKEQTGEESRFREGDVGLKYSDNCRLSHKHNVYCTAVRTPSHSSVRVMFPSGASGSQVV